jgi:hypothetical protein
VTADAYVRRIDDETARSLSTLERSHDLIAKRLDTGEPEALRRPVPLPEPYPVEALGPILGPACETLQRIIQAPDAICGGSLLAAASLCAQPLADVINDGRTHPLTLWMLSVASSGERKSAVDSEAMRPIREFEKTLSVALEPQVQKHMAAMEEWQARKDAIKKRQKAGIGLAAALEELGPSPAPPLRPTVIAGDFTSEGLTKLLAIGRPSMGAFTDEAALVFGGHGMSKEAVARTAATLSKLWDNGTLDRIRAGDGAIKLYGRRLAMHLMAQPIIVEGALSDDVLLGQGFLARTLLSWPVSTIGSRLYLQANLRDEPTLIRYQARAADLLNRDLPLAPNSQNELAPPALALSPDAGQLWRDFHDAVEAEMKPGGKFATALAWASKTPEQAVRVAGVLTLFDNPDGLEVDAATMDRAIELALWHLGEAVRLVGTATVSREVRNAESLLAWAHERNHRLLYSTLALHGGPACIRENRNFIDAMGELERTSWATRVEGGTVVDGKRRKNVWDIRPRSAAQAA